VIGRAQRGHTKSDANVTAAARIMVYPSPGLAFTVMTLSDQTEAKGSPMLARRHVLISGAALGLAAAAPSWAQTADRPNPMPEDLRRSLERDPNAPVLGNPDGDITLTEFFDYNCGFCRKMVEPMQQLISGDPKLRIVYREWPVFGEGSDFAARVSLATLRQKKYWQFHSRMMANRGRADQISAMRVAGDIGLDLDRLRADMERPEVEEHISMSFMLADHMSLSGTPSFICGDEGVFGEMTLKELQALVQRGRKTLGVG
jgi:protein-disulfide isomerase